MPARQWSSDTHKDKNIRTKSVIGEDSMATIDSGLDVVILGSLPTKIPVRMIEVDTVVVAQSELVENVGDMQSERTTYPCIASSTVPPALNPLGTHNSDQIL